MKKFLALLKVVVLLAMLSGCNEPTKEVIEEWTPGHPKRIVWTTEEDGEKFTVREERYYENNQLEFEGEYDVEGRRHGQWKYFFPNGALWSIGSFDHGIKTGKKEVYWPSGQMRYEGQFEKDQKQGKWVFYQEDGSVLQEIVFKNDEREGAAATPASGE